MESFVIKNINGDIKQELSEIGFDKNYLNKGSRKFIYKNLKIFGLTPIQANILKQTALSLGADCGTHRQTITCGIEKTDVILGGSISQLYKISESLKFQPFNLKNLGELLEKKIEVKFKPFKVKGRNFNYSRPYLVGILNLNQSFSDGYTTRKMAVEQLETLIQDGADIIDIGAESTRPGARAVDDDSQLEKILPILKYIDSENIKIPISIDTRSSNVAKVCLTNGADIINDVSGFDYDDKMMQTATDFGCPVVIQHSSSIPEDMQTCTDYDNVVDDIFKSLHAKVEQAKMCGIKENKIILDVGIGFGKTRLQNLELLKNIMDFEMLPLMVGISRKSFLNIDDENYIKDIYTLALNSVLMEKGVNFIRVHNVKLHKKLFEILGY